MRNTRHKRAIATFESLKAVGLNFGNREIIYDHTIPLKVLLERLLNLDPIAASSVRQLLDEKLKACIITREEDQLLNRNGYRDATPDPNKVDARYEAVGIRYQANSYKDKDPKS